MTIQRDVFICNNGGGYTENASEWRDYTTGAPVPAAPLANAAGPWVDYQKPGQPVGNESQTERFRQFTIAGLTQQLAEISQGLHGADLQRALPRLREKLAMLLEEIDVTIAAGPVHNAAEWTPYEKPQPGQRVQPVDRRGQQLGEALANRAGDTWIDYEKPQVGR